VKSAGFQRRLNEARQLLLGQHFAQALLRYAKLTRTFPGQAVVWFEYGTTAARLGQLEGASRAWERAMQLEPRNAELIVQIGHQYQGLRKPEQARGCFARAAAADSKAINPRVSLAVLLEQQHRLDQARAAVEECLAIDPRDDQARYLSAMLDRRENQLEAAENRLRELIQSEPKHPYVRYACRYELAQVLDRTGRFDEAMKLLAEAKQLVRALTDTDVLLQNYDRTAESARQFAASQPKNILLAWAKSFPAPEREVIPPLAFLGGHPRSGTTLLEQVLGAHPGVAALDEPLAFADVLQTAFCQRPEPSSAQ
jgi:tetratricopeptide (TPR) repeat protein